MKEELQNYKEKEAQLMKCNEELEKNETRLKTIADADGIKHELESKLEALKVEGSEKMIQIQNYRLKEGKCESAEKLWRDILSNCSIVVNLSDAMKKKFEEKKSLMIDHETSNENLEFVEKQLLGEYTIQTTLNPFELPKYKEVTVHQKMELSSVLVHLAQKENL